MFWLKASICKEQQVSKPPPWQIALPIVGEVSDLHRQIRTTKKAQVDEGDDCQAGILHPQQGYSCMCLATHAYSLQLYLKKSSDGCLQLLCSFRGGVLDDVIACCPAG